MNQPRKPKKVKAPEGCDSYLIEGKEYEVYDVVDDFGLLTFYITCEHGTCFCIENGCSHLKGGDWIVTEWEDENN